VNKRIIRIFGVVLSLVMLLAILPGPALANPDDDLWSEFKVPKTGTTGSWVLAPGSGAVPVGPIAKAVNGDLYCYADGLTDTDYTLFKSTDAGKTWSYVGKVDGVIVDIATSPSDANVVYYCTTTAVYKSTNGGSTFTQMVDLNLTSEEITSLDVAKLSDSYVVVVGTKTTAYAGRVLILDEGVRINPSWTDQVVGSGLNVLDAVLAPDFDISRAIVALVSTDNVTYVKAKLGTGGWNSDIGNATLEPGNVTGQTVGSTAGSIGFPSDWDSDPATGNTTLFVGVTGTGHDTAGAYTADKGDAYQVIGVKGAGKSVALDLGLGSATATINVTDIAVNGPASNANILAGTTSADKAKIYRSNDAGSTWYKTKKEPTGDSTSVYVVMADDYDSSLMAWAAVGTTSAGGNGGVSIQVKDRIWNTLSLINTTIAGIDDFSPTSDTKVNFMATHDANNAFSVWLSGSWQRVFSSTLEGAPDEIDMVETSPGWNTDSAVFLGNAGSTDAMWRSVDGGQYFEKQTRAPSTTYYGWVIIDSQNIVVGQAVASQRTTNNGRSWDTAVSLTSAGNVLQLVKSPDYDNDLSLLAGDSAGRVFRTTDGAKTWSELKTTNMTGPVIPAFDNLYSSNATMYCTDNAGGVFRYIKGTSSEWARIDAKTGSYTVAQGTGLVVSGKNNLYATDSSAAGEGVSRSLDARNSVVSTPYPFFDKVNQTVEGDLTSILSKLWLSPGTSTIWTLHGGVKVYVLNDTIVNPVVLVSPKNNASTGRTDRVVLTWEAVTNANTYELDVNTQFDFKGEVLLATTTKSTSYTYQIGAAYTGIPLYWRVRVYEHKPYRSPRSATWTFSTELTGAEWNPFRTSEGYPGNVAPVSGASGVGLIPTFQWNPADWATGYELQLSLNDSFTSPLASVKVTNPVWMSNVTLKNATVYFWRVRAFNDTTVSAWGVGAFTTASVAVAPVPPITITQAAPAAPPVVIPPTPAPITPGYIWAIIAIGAVLVIAVIILIVRTRRVT